MSNIKEKIQKIIAKAQSTTNEAEAEMLFAKAHELMERHQIEAFELGDDSDPVGMTVGATGQSGPSSYRPMVQRTLAAYYGARAIRKYLDSKRYQVEIVGPESARITTELMTDFVWDQIKATATALAAQGEGKRDALIRKVANALCHRISKLVVEKDDAPKKKTVAAQKNALVVKDAVAAWIEEHYQGLMQSKGGRRSSTAAANKAAQGISLHRQTGGSAAPLRIGK